MSLVRKSSAMLSPKSFVKLLGAEYDLMRNTGVLKRFYLSAILILLIALLTCVSIFYAIALLFHSLIVEAALSLFFSLLFLCIYIFLLNTFSKEEQAKKRVLYFSDIVRIGFIAFMGFLIAQPIAILFYSKSLSADVEKYKEELIQTHSRKIAGLTKSEVTALTARYQYYIDQKEQFGTAVYDNQLNKIDNTLKAIQDKVTALEQTANSTINNNSFFLYRVKKVSHSYWFSWLITVFIMALFLSPGYLIYTVSGESEYYQAKKANEKQLIKNAYQFFLVSYKKLFENNIEIFSRYIDPPFNTVRKQPPATATVTDFVKKHLDKH